MTAETGFPVLISALCVIPAFFITRRVVGNFGGFIAATIVAIHPSFLSRTAGGFADTGTLEAQGIGSRAFGNASSDGTIQAVADGSLAHGYTNGINSLIQANGQGSHASGNALLTCEITIYPTIRTTPIPIAPIATCINIF